MKKKKDKKFLKDEKKIKIRSSSDVDEVTKTWLLFHETVAFPRTGLQISVVTVIEKSTIV